MKVRVKTFGRPAPIQHGDWIDLTTVEDANMRQGEYRLISLGVAMELPAGYEAHLAPRSSTCGKFGVIQANSVGVIDNAYCGDDDVWKFPAVAIKDTFIPAGTRICQFRLVKVQDPVEFEVVETLGNKNRGGFGSTGVR